MLQGYHLKGHLMIFDESDPSENPENFDVSSELVDRIRNIACAMAFKNANPNTKVDLDKIKIAEKTINELMPVVRAEKIIEDHHNGGFEMKVKDIEKIAAIMTKEITTVVSIKMAAEGELEMAWDDKEQDFVFRSIDPKPKSKGKKGF